MNKIPHFTEGKTDLRDEVSCPVMGTQAVEEPISPQLRALLTRPRATKKQVNHTWEGPLFFLPTLLRALTQRYVYMADS